MGTLLTGTVNLETLERYFTVADLALITGETEKWITKQREAGIIAPVLFKGRHQYSRGSLLKLQALRALQSELGAHSPVPARVVKRAGPVIDKLCQGEMLYTVDAHRALADAVMAVVFTKEVEAALYWQGSNLAHTA